MCCASSPRTNHQPRPRWRSRRPAAPAASGPAARPRSGPPAPSGSPTGRAVWLRGDADTPWKDVVVHRDGDDWHMWACRHPLDGGDNEADRMTSCYATSPDGLKWTFVSTALAPTPDTWDSRGTRITSVLR